MILLPVLSDAIPYVPIALTTVQLGRDSCSRHVCRMHAYAAAEKAPDEPLPPPPPPPTACGAGGQPVCAGDDLAGVCLPPESSPAQSLILREYLVALCTVQMLIVFSRQHVSAQSIQSDN